MKTIKNIHFILFFIVSMVSWSQTNQATDNYFQISPRVGYDFPTYHNNTPYIDYNGGIMAGLSLDYYWNWIGVGTDFDYIKNSPENIYPTNLTDFDGSAFTDFRTTEDGITRMFYGIGPNFQYRSPSRQFTAEFNTRVGLGSIKGGRLTHEGDTAVNTGVPLNFHAGYDIGNALSYKLQARFNYFFNNGIGLHAGAYYMRHLNATESVENGISTGYHELTEDAGDYFLTQRDYRVREEPCDCDISSIGVFAGVTFKLQKGAKEEACNVCDKYNLAVTARDKYTGELLPDTDVVLKNTAGDIVQTGTTNAYGVVVFNDIEKDNYTIEGKLYDVNLDGNAAVKSEFKENETLQKEIIYSDLNFILKGNAVVCNTTTPLDGVSVILNNLNAAEQKNTLTDTKGEFIFNIKQKSTYSLRGKKANYFSQTETISTANYDRSTTLFVQLEVCLEQADCGRAIALKNILYDLDKYFIRDDAKPELNRLVQFMKDNPGVRIEISSHTDSRGSDAYNKNLSQNRASAARDYIASQGVDANRVVGIGYGESRLLNRCADNVDCSEAEHQINRRTEMKVICPQ